MEIHQPTFEHLLEVCIRNGSVQSRRSWERYGRDLYDFFCFTEANAYDWKASMPKGMPSLLEIYRDWSLEECKLSDTTVNQRVRTVQRFYAWAVEQNYMTRVPWNTRAIRLRESENFFAHLGEGQRVVQSTSVLLRALKKPIKFLTLAQCAECIKATPNVTHRLLFRLALQTGIRSEELQTFPEKYVFNPKDRSDLRTQHKVRVHLDPMDMKLKGNRARSIDVPLELMADLWQYTVLDRPRLARAAGKPSPKLFLTEMGGQFTKYSIQNVFATIRRKVRFHVSCHMLRHTYATYTLHGLREAEFAGEPLMYVRDRLGHSSVKTTEIYLHLLNQISADLVLSHDREIDAIFAKVT